MNIDWSYVIIKKASDISELDISNQMKGFNQEGIYMFLLKSR